MLHCHTHPVASSHPEGLPLQSPPTLPHYSSGIFELLFVFTVDVAKHTVVQLRKAKLG